MNKTFMLLSAVILAVALRHPAAASDAPPVAPINQPLVVLRAANAKLVQSVLATRQARALELDQKDFSGRIPGVDARIDSLKAFLAGLAYGDAQNLWYCLSQQGSSLATQTGAMGWDAVDARPDAPLPQVAEWLEQMGLDVRGLDLEVRPLAPEKARLIISRDSDGRREVFGGGGKADGGWRGNLSDFLAGSDDSVGIWANTRPILGLLSLLSGIDFRAKMNAHNMGAPVWTQLELFNNQGDLGFEARVNNILPQGVRNSEAEPVIIHSRSDPLLEINFPAPAGLWEMLDVDKDAFFFANINVLAMVPRSVAVTIHKTDAGHAWDMVCLMPDKAKFNAQLGRVRSWLEVLSAASSSAFGIEETKSCWGDALWKIHVGELAMVMGVVDIDAAAGDNAFLVLAPSVDDWPNPMDLKVAVGDKPCIVEWRANLDAASRADIIRNLADLSAQRGAKDFTAGFWDAMLPDRDNGRVGMEGDTLVIRSDHGLLPMLAPDVIELFRGAPDAEGSQVQKVAARLRFLLDVANQSRYRGLGTGKDAPDALPATLSELADGDARWLDYAHDAFPGVRNYLSEVVTTLAAGDSLDGFRYAIDDRAGSWNLVAENGQGLAVRLDDAGRLTVVRDGVAVAEREQLFTLPKLLR